MVTLFSHRVPLATVFQVALEAAVFALAILVAIQLKAPDLIEPGGLVLLPAGLFALLMIVINSAIGLYRQDPKVTLSDLLAKKVLALGVGLPIAYLAFSVLPGSRIFTSALGEGLLLAIVGVAAAGLLQRSSSQSTLLTHRILVVGAGRDAELVETALASSKGFGVDVVGFYAPNQSEHSAAANNKVITSPAALSTLVQELAVDEVVVAIREQRGGVLPLRELVECRLHGVRITCLASFFERFEGKIPIDSLKAGWLIYSDGFRQGWGRTFIKRCFDLVASIVLLVPGLPAMVLIAIAIIIESGGPVIYRQARVGAGGRIFSVLKFRSMHNDAEPDGTPRWACKNDSRITRVGRFLRKFRMDELPQIFNVLRGDMSFVGPRPERPYFVEQLTEKVPFYNARHSIKPGITGWAQVRCSYGASVEGAILKLQYDLYYVKNHTLLLDAIILLETVRVVLSGEGAR